jgi:hypothetical protein
MSMAARSLRPSRRRSGNRIALHLVNAMKRLGTEASPPNASAAGWAALPIETV